jgi:hypothetical protein
LPFLIKKRRKKLFSCYFFQFLVIKTLEPDPDSLERQDPNRIHNAGIHLGKLLFPAFTSLALVLHSRHLGQAEGNGGQQSVGQSLKNRVKH